MLELIIPPNEYTYENENGEVFFHKFAGGRLQLEHSLISLSKWESHYKKPFLDNNEKTNEETLYYIKCMTINKNVDDVIYNFLSSEHMKKISDYISDSMTATTFSDDKRNRPRGREIVTSEIIYYWMVALQIPIKFETWHLNRLITLIRVCEIKQQPAKKMSKKDLYARNSKLNAARRKAHGSKG